MLDELPPEVVVHVLSYLTLPEVSVFALVQRKWHTLANEPSLWREFYFRGKIYRPAADGSNRLNDSLTTEPLSQSSRGSEERSKWPVKADTSPRDFIDVETGGIDWKTAVAHSCRLKKRWLQGHYTEKDVYQMTSGVYTVKFDQERVVIGCNDGQVHVLRRDSGDTVKTIKAHEVWVGAVQYDDEKLVSCGGDGRVRVYDWDYKCILDIDVPDCRWMKRMQYDRTLLATGSGDHIVRLWRWHDLNQDKKEPCTILKDEGSSGGILGLELGRNTVVAGCLGGAITVWDVETGQLSSNLHCVSKSASDVDVRYLMASERLIVAGCDDSRIRIWDIASGVLVKSLKGHEKAVKYVYFDDHKIISGGAEGTAMVWDNRGTAKKPALYSIHIHESDVIAMDVHESSLMSGSLDTTVRAFSVA